MEKSRSGRNPRNAGHFEDGSPHAHLLRVQPNNEEGNQESDEAHGTNGDREWIHPGDPSHRQ